MIDVADDGEVADSFDWKHEMASVPTEGRRSGNVVPGTGREPPDRQTSVPWHRVGTGTLACYSSLSSGMALIKGVRIRSPVPLGRNAVGADTRHQKRQGPPVANIKSQIKRNRQTVKRQARNKAVRSELRTRTKRALVAIDEGAENSEVALRLAVKRIDKAAAKGVIHKNQAANRKARLMRRAAAAQSADA
jgi:small subunit ribosomal protein S20